jgi:pimeloyl-ACP methyl ester carboxylesterase
VFLEVARMKLTWVEKGRGEPLVLVHGFPLDHTMWRGQLAALSPQRRVIAVDLCGFGQSALPPDHDGSAYAMAEHADDLAELLDALSLPQPIDLAGLSMGGYVALEFQRRHGSRLRRLILCDTRSEADSPEAAANRLAVAETVLREGVDEMARSMIGKLFGGATLREQEELVQQTLEVMLRTDPRSVAAAQRGMATRSDAGPWLAQITCPCLVICGAEDAITPAAGMRELARRLHAEYCEVPGAGHMAPLEAPAVVNAAIEAFLQGSAGRQGDGLA